MKHKQGEQECTHTLRETYMHREKETHTERETKVHGETHTETCKIEKNTH